VPGLKWPHIALKDASDLAKRPTSRKLQSSSQTRQLIPVARIIIRLRS